MTLTHFSLFTGIGGIDLAAEWAGFQTVGQCEWADYPTKVLEKNWPDVPRWRDVRDVTTKSVKAKMGGGASITLLSGGFPCQPHSVIGSRKAEQDERHLWPEFLRVIQELQPPWVLGENVNGLLSTIHESVCTDLEQEGYEVRTFCAPAYAVGAHHERYRVFIAGFSESKSRLQTNSKADSDRTRRKTRTNPLLKSRDSLPGAYWATHQPPICGVDDGLSIKLDGYKPRMMTLGNAVVPQQIYPILKAIAEIEEALLA